MGSYKCSQNIIDCLRSAAKAIFGIRQPKDKLERYGRIKQKKVGHDFHDFTLAKPVDMIYGYQMKNTIQDNFKFRCVTQHDQTLSGLVNGLSKLGGFKRFP